MGDKMVRTCKKTPIKALLCISSAMILLGSVAASVDACEASAGEVDASCYGGNLPAAVADALAFDRPLLLPAGSYALSQTLVIDYSARANSGFRIISRGARIDGTAIRNGPVLAIVCS